MTKVASWRSWLGLWGVDLLVAVISVLLIQASFGRTLPGDRFLDLGSFIASAQAAQSGLNPYGVYPPLTWRVVAPGLDVWNMNLNPPISILLFQVFTVAEPKTIFAVWYVANVLVHAAIITLLVHRFRREVLPVAFALWAFALAGFWDALQLGQIYGPLALAATGAWLLLEQKRYTWAGVLIGLIIAVKPQFLVWPALLFLSGYMRPVIVSGVTAAVCSAIPALVYGPHIYGQWIEMLAADAPRAVFLTNMSLVGYTARINLRIVGLFLSGALLLGAAFWAWRKRRDLADLSAFALVLSLLTAPLAWVQYAVFLLPVICAKWRVPGVRLAALLLLVPAWVVGAQVWQPLQSQLTLGSVYNWALLLLFSVLVFDQFRKGRAAKLGRSETMNAAPAENRSNAWAPAGPNLILAAVAVAVIAVEFPRTLPGPFLLDFGSFFESGKAAREGLNPFGIYPLTFRVGAGVNPNLNPPISALLFQAFTVADPHLMFGIWYGLSLAMYAAVIFLLLRRYSDTPRLPFILVACALAGLWETLVLGQIYIPLVLAGVGAWLLLERGSMTAAGILIGMVIAMKPNFAVWPALLFLTGRFRPALVSGAVAVVISAIPLVVFGPGIYPAWFEAVSLEKDRPAFLSNAAISGLALRAELPLLGVVVPLLLLGAAAVWAFVRRPSIPKTSMVALLLSVLASPLGWVNYTLFLLPVFCWKWSSPVVRIVLALLMVPVPFVLSEFPYTGFRALTRGSIYNWALLLLLAAIIASELRKFGFFAKRDPLAPRDADPANAAPAA